MRKQLCFTAMLVALLSLCAPAPADTVPQSAAAFFSDRITQGYEIAAWADGGRYAAAVLSRDGENRLAVLRTSGDSYRIEVSSGKAVYQGALLPELYFDSDLYLFVNYRRSGGIREEYIYQRDDDGVWMLCEYDLWDADGSMRMFVARPEELVYFYLPDAATVTLAYNVYGVYQRALRYLNIRTLPRTLEEARETLSLPPEIPEDDFDAVTVQFRGGEKYEVYTAPDDTSLRAADGKAMVSTNDWIQVFGTEAGWALIQYEVSDIKNRIGYITQTALPGNTSVSELAFIPQEIEILRDAPVTDDPLEWQLGFTTVREGQEGCAYLATFNDAWVYIEGTDPNGQRFRGFVETDAVRIVLPEDEK